MSTTNSIDLGGLSKQYAARDLPSHQKLKYRDIGQAAPEEVRKDKKELRRELEERERLSSNKDSKRLSIVDSSKESEKSKKLKVDQTPQAVNLDADEILPDDSDEEEEDVYKRKSKNKDDSENESEQEEDEDEDDEDETAALMAELNRIKQERAAEAERLEAERKAREEKIRVENILKGNPLLNPGVKATTSSEFKVKRRWDDDVVFKNCAKNEGEVKKKDFINDTLRSEFHKKFMDRYIK